MTSASRPRVTPAGLVVAGTNVSIAALYLSFAWVHGRAFADRPHASYALMLVLEGIAAVLALARSPASRSSVNVATLATTAGGTFAPLLLRPAATDDLFAGEALVVIGTTVAIVGLLSLNRSFGLLPARREIRSTGMYRFVRHPLYASYFVAQLGYVLSNRTAWNLAIVVAASVFQVMRLLSEERFLSTDPEYAAYALRTRWRLIPFVF